jgi:TetR/AcrR family transcriptional repressor of nem operon
VTTASLHYHFPGKTSLGEALVGRWTERHLSALAEIERTHSSGLARLEAYTALYKGVYRGSRMGLCGMLAAEHQTLPPAMRTLVAAFLTANEQWLERVLRAGRDDGSLDFNGPARDAALVFLAGVQGATLIARPHGDADRFHTVAHGLLATLVPASQGRAATGSRR